ncbi:MAG: hypothetical protein K2K97_07645 [Muribaculaceae bacterium]|nr:hypothetical protein [Muribaculaceae bacterium]
MINISPAVGMRLIAFSLNCEIQAGEAAHIVREASAVVCSNSNGNTRASQCGNGQQVRLSRFLYVSVTRAEGYSGQENYGRFS